MGPGRPRWWARASIGTYIPTPESELGLDIGYQVDDISLKRSSFGSRLCHIHKIPRTLRF